MSVGQLHVAIQFSPGKQFHERIPAEDACGKLMTLSSLSLCASLCGVSLTGQQFAYHGKDDSTAIVHKVRRYCPLKYATDVCD